MNLRHAAALAVLGSLFCLAAGPAHATASNKELEARANEMDSRLAAVERSSQTLVVTQQQIEAARAELRSLRGQIEEARHDLETLKQQQRDLYADLDRRLLLLEHGAAPSAGTAGATAPAVAGSAAGGTTAPPPSESDIRSQDEEIVYGDSFAALKAARYDDAIRGFRLYLTKYPDGPRADNATYWLGEAQYVQRDYTAALESFQTMLERFPDSRKAADALLKVGFSQYELKAFRNARATLEKVAASYPGTEAARLASERLARMDVERR